MQQAQDSPDKKQCRDLSGGRTMQYWHMGLFGASMRVPGCTHPGSDAYRLAYMAPAVRTVPTAPSMYSVSYQEKCCQSSAPA